MILDFGAARSNQGHGHVDIHFTGLDQRVRGNGRLGVALAKKVEREFVEIFRKNRISRIITQLDLVTMICHGQPSPKFHGAVFLRIMDALLLTRLRRGIVSLRVVLGCSRNSKNNGRQKSILTHIDSGDECHHPSVLST